MKNDEENSEVEPELRFGEKIQRQLLRDAPRLRSYIASKIGPGLADWVTPEDVLQDVWVSVFRGLNKFRPVGPDALGRWTTVLADRRLIDAIRIARNQTKRQARGVNNGGGDAASSLAAMLTDFAIDLHTPSGVISSQEVTSAVHLALAQLAPDNRQAVVLFHLQGESIDNIAQLMGKSSAAVSGILFRSRRQLSELLGRMSRYLGEASRS